MKKRNDHFLKLVLVVGIIILVFICLSLAREITRKRQLNKEISSLRDQISELEKNKEEFSELIDYLNTESFVEQEARMKLGLQKEGESLVIIPENAFNIVQGNTGGKTDEDAGTSENNTENYSKWWQYFFGY